MGKKIIITLLPFLIFFCFLVLHQNILSKISSRVEGAVVEKTTGQPIADASVYLYELLSDFSGIMHEHKTVTDKEGKFKFADVANGVYFLRCVKGGYISFLPGYYYGPWVDSEMSPASPVYLYKDKNELEKAINIFNLDEGKIKHFKIALERGGGIKGKVSVNQGSGIYGIHCYVSLFRQKEAMETYFLKDELKIITVSTDEEGYFEINDLVPSDKYYLTLNSPNFMKSKQIENITIKKSKTTDVTYTVDWRGTSGIKGNVRIRDRIPSSAHVKIFTADNVFLRTTYTDDKGNFCLYEFEPGTYLLEFAAFEFIGMEDRSYDKKITINLKKAEIKVLDVNMWSN